MSNAGWYVGDLLEVGDARHPFGDLDGSDSAEPDRAIGDFDLAAVELSPDDRGGLD